MTKIIIRKQLHSKDGRYLCRNIQIKTQLSQIRKITLIFSAVFVKHRVTPSGIRCPGQYQGHKVIHFDSSFGGSAPGALNSSTSLNYFRNCVFFFYDISNISSYKQTCLLFLLPLLLFCFCLFLCILTLNLDNFGQGTVRLGICVQNIVLPTQISQTGRLNVQLKAFHIGIKS